MTHQPRGYQNELSKCSTSDGPMVLVSNSSLDLSSVVLSAASHFTAYHPSVAPNKDGSVLSMSPLPKNAPAGTVFTSVLLARPHLTRAYQAWGSFQRQLHTTVRARGSGVSQLSYWDDNEAGYSYWSAAKNLNQWGVPEDIFLQLIASYHQQVMAPPTHPHSSIFVSFSLFLMWCYLFIFTPQKRK